MRDVVRLFDVTLWFKHHREQIFPAMDRMKAERRARVVAAAEEAGEEPPPDEPQLGASDDDMVVGSLLFVLEGY